MKPEDITRLGARLTLWLTVPIIAGLFFGLAGLVVAVLAVAVWEFSTR